MKNKILIYLSVPALANSYDIYIPVNERIDKIIHLILVGLQDLSGYDFEKNNVKYLLINSITGNVYGNNDIVRDTDIRNSSKLILVSDK